jgi:murein endopeptidase/LysM repeat protein
MHPSSGSAKTWLVNQRAASLAIVARRRVQLTLCAIVIALVATSTWARAGVASRRSHRVTSGDSLWKIARTYQCTVDDLRRVNRLDGNTIQPGQRLRIPSCKSHTASLSATEARRERAAVTERTLERTERERDRDDEDRSKEPDDLGVPEEDPIVPIDPYSPVDPVVDPPVVDPPVVDPPAPEPDRGDRVDESTAGERGLGVVAVPIIGQSIGRPQRGYLVSGRHMPRNARAYYLRRPERAWGTDQTVELILRAIRQVRRRYPRVHPLAIGDISARHGGRLTMHGSHQSGRDADIGFYFRKPPRGYPKGFAVATAANLDFRATWAFISALCRTADDKLGVERIYMTYRTQALFHRLARKHGVSRALLDKWFQYPRGRRADHGIIRHEPGHEEHIHVRFRCAPDDPECR